MVKDNININSTITVTGSFKTRNVLALYKENIEKNTNKKPKNENCEKTHFFLMH